jgi:hypothetical protein
VPDDGNDDNQEGGANNTAIVDENGNGEKNHNIVSKAKKVDKGEAFRREMAQVQFRNFVHEQQFYSWQFRSGRLFGRGEGTKDEAAVETKEGESSA